MCTSEWAQILVAFQGSRLNTQRARVETGAGEASDSTRSVQGQEYER